MSLRSTAIAIGLLAATVLSSQQPASVPQFTGSTPCGRLIGQFLGMQPSFPCERVTWTLRLRDTSFELDATYGMQAVNDPGFAPRAVETRLRGSVVRGGPIASYIASETFTLTSDSGRTLGFALIDGALLHVLDARGDLMRGDGGWSYTLTRGDAPAVRARRLQPLSPARADAAGDFEGRTPCSEISRMLQLTPAADCLKLKWALTLAPDGTYRLEGTLYRDRVRTGRWQIQIDQATGAMVYVLDPGRPSTLSLLKAGPDVLFFLDPQGAVLGGNASHSYTLNRSGR